MADVKQVASGAKLESIGTVKSVVGTVKAVDQSGAERILQAGDKVFANETVVTADGGLVLIEFADGSHLDLASTSQIILDSDVFNPANAKGEELTAEQIQEMIARGEDPTTVTEATAAGAGSGDEGGSSFVDVAFNNTQGHVNSGLETQGIPGPDSITFTEQPPVEDESAAVAAAVVDDTPTGDTPTGDTPDDIPPEEPSGPAVSFMAYNGHNWSKGSVNGENLQLSFNSENETVRYTDDGLGIKQNLNAAKGDDLGIDNGEALVINLGSDATSASFTLTSLGDEPATGNWYAFDGDNNLLATGEINVNGSLTIDLGDLGAFQYVVFEAHGPGNGASDAGFYVSSGTVDGYTFLTTGASGADDLSGGIGNDILIGGADDDILMGGAGDDILTGGNGADTFTWNDGDLAGTVDGDTVTDFEVNVDTLNFDDLLAGSGGSLGIVVEAGNTTVTLTTDSGTVDLVTLTGITGETLNTLLSTSSPD